MKRVFTHPEPTRAEQTGPRYWRSLDELQETPGFKEYVAREFPEGASELDEVDRRHFFKIMAASFAFGGFALSGCRRPEAKILAYAKTPEHNVTGLPLYYASSFPLRGSAMPIVVETHAGRPTKIEGNPSYTPNGGATDLMAQASILDLYDPDRSIAHRKAGARTTVAEVNDLLAGIGRRYASNGGAGLAFLAEQSSSPTRLRLVRALKARFPQAVWAEYEPLASIGSVRAASAAAGRPAKTHLSLASAARILTVDADILGSGEGHVSNARSFADGRRLADPVAGMNRLYSVESALTITGGMADHRLRLASGQMTAFLAQLALAVGVAPTAGLSGLASAAPAEARWIEACAADLKAHRGTSLVVAGEHLPEAAHAVALLINQALGNMNRTMMLLETGAESAASIGDLASAVRSGTISTLVVLGGNPVYNAPADLDWASLQKSIGEVVRLGYYEDETSDGVQWHLTAAHYLESWGDARTPEGVVVPVQPMILPLFGGLTEIEVMARILGEQSPDPYSQVFATIQTLASSGDGAEKAFKRFLHEGVLEGTGYRAASGFSVGQLAALVSAAPAPLSPTADSLEVVFAADLKLDDGRFVNNGWLQECPDPISKLTWDNAINVSPRLAAELGIVAKDSALQITRKNPNSFDIGKQTAPWARISVDGRSVEGPVHIQPGLANYTVILPLGYGRSRTGRIGTGSGFNAYSVRTTDSLSFAQGGKIELIPGRSSKLANTQEHWSMEGRAIVREANLEDYVAHPDFVDTMGMESHTPPVYGKDTDMPLAGKVSTSPRGQSLYEHPNLDGSTHPNIDGTHQWGMTIDLNVCTGCNACVVACQSENNIPIVGRDQVRRGREMHWIRLDRYYSDGRTLGEAFGGKQNSEIPEDPQVSLQPVGCLHCETAPCETVCPVNATVHDEEGLNTMAYNRCVGTRYCANNCPYKVRRFNFFDFNQRRIDSLYSGPTAPKGMPELVQMSKNPDVTVRMRGVMEKCTYCVQRIQEAKIAAKVRARGSADVVVRDGELKVACQQVCPTEAIVFGNLLDPESKVSKAKASNRDYSLLGYLNTRPRTTYLARIRNPNRDMPDYRDLPLSRVEYDARNPHGDHGHGDHGHDSNSHAPSH
ncbi:TAT-variant-translocated molybdopterin oxidoreductase [Opitutales bacterium ASA1]|uniref:TAT-variant-translocated molybdopterin oxidoreductase n=1 Tax=Congregicoccus parvus TaxID=3081749 RepID=UPI002B2D080A|nr:TAT-variant-translocated molybdopterin oxidoreductase [Opitutales bacterium ASA1]